MKRRAFMVMLVMLLSLLLFVMGMGFLGKRSAQYSGAISRMKAAQARALAQAGLEDARVKLEKDLFFPPPGDRDQTLFSYTEEVKDDAGAIVGYYTVTLDSRYRHAPDPPDESYPSVILVEAIGSLGADSQRPDAVVHLKMEVDLDDGKRNVAGRDPIPPSQPLRVTNYSEE